MLKKIGIGAVGLVVLLVIIGQMGSSGGEAEPNGSPAAEVSSESSPSPSPTPEPSPSPTPDWASGVPVTPDSVRAVLADSDEVTGSEKLAEAKDVMADDASGTIALSYHPDAVWDNNHTLTITSRTAYSAARALFTNPRVQSVSVQMYGDWTDQYGQTTEEMSTDLLLTRVTADKINWEGLERQVKLDNKHLFCLADKRFIHPAIMADIEDKGCLAA